MTVEEFLQRPYARVVRQDEDGDYVVRIDELPGCVAHGDTLDEAMQRLTEIQRLWYEDAAERDEAIPEPAPDADELPSGKWLQRVPRSLHQRLIALAKADGVSLNQFVTAALASVAGTREREAQVGAQIVAAVRGTITSCLRARSLVVMLEGNQNQMWDVHQTQGRITDANALTLIDSITGQMPGNEERENVFYGFATNYQRGHVSGLPEKRTAKRGWSKLHAGETR